MTAHDSVPEFCPPPPMSGLLDVEVVRDEAGERTVVVNLAGTTFVDVGGMCTLLETTGSARRRGSRLYLAGCSTQLVRLLHLTDLFDEVEVISSGRT